MSNEGHPWRNWKITLVAMDGEKEVKGRLTLLLDHVDYILHPTFKDPRRGIIIIVRAKLNHVFIPSITTSRHKGTLSLAGKRLG
jgi:hypothetical protein